MRIQSGTFSAKLLSALYLVIRPLALIYVSVSMVMPASAAEPIVVKVDLAKVMRVNAEAQTVVVGNPLIADVTMSGKNLLVITGKSYGETNLLLIDKSGAVIAEYPVVVSTLERSHVTVFRQGSRSTLSCAPVCEQHLKVGDRKDYFDGLAAAIGTRNKASANNATGSVQ